MLAMGPCGGIFGDVHSVKAKRGRIDFGPYPAFGQTCPSRTDRFDLGPQQLDPALEGVPDAVVMPGLAVFDDHGIRIVFSACLGHEEFGHGRSPLEVPQPKAVETRARMKSHNPATMESEIH